jgi:hypothetical protein
MRILSIVISFILLISCTSSSSRRVHEKQRTASDVQIDALDLANKKLELRFEYRTYVEKTLTSIDCDLTLNEKDSVKIIKNTNIELGAFSTEIISFNVDALPTLKNLDSIKYTLQCIALYNKGKEYINKDSVLHLVPASQNKYR